MPTGKRQTAADWYDFPEDILWGEGAAPTGQEPSPGGELVRLPHDLDWEPFGEPFDVEAFGAATAPGREEARTARILYLEADSEAAPDPTAEVRELLAAAGYRMEAGHPDDFDWVDLACGADLLLVDLPPSAGSARDLLRPLWADPKAASVPVIFLTSDPGAPAHAVSVGGADHLARPADPQLLLDVVAARLASRRALARLFAPDS